MLLFSFKLTSNIHSDKLFVTDCESFFSSDRWWSAEPFSFENRWIKHAWPSLQHLALQFRHNFFKWKIAFKMKIFRAKSSSRSRKKRDQRQVYFHSLLRFFFLRIAWLKFFSCLDWETRVSCELILKYKKYFRCFSCYYSLDLIGTRLERLERNKSENI